MKVLARTYHQNRDKTNCWFETVEEALSYLGQTKDNISVKVGWLNYTDIFFKGTSDYIRIKHHE